MYCAFLIIAALILLPFLIYLWVKIGTVAVLRGRQFYNDLQKRRMDDE